MKKVVSFVKNWSISLLWLFISFCMWYAFDVRAFCYCLIAYIPFFLLKTLSKVLRRIRGKHQQNSGAYNTADEMTAAFSQGGYDGGGSHGGGDGGGFM
jgi:uncharacterized membrane protein YgcG